MGKGSISKEGLKKNLDGKYKYICTADPGSTFDNDRVFVRSGEFKLNSILHDYNISLDVTATRTGGGKGNKNTATVESVQWRTRDSKNDASGVHGPNYLLIKYEGFNFWGNINIPFDYTESVFQFNLGRFSYETSAGVIEGNIAVENIKQKFMDNKIFVVHGHNNEIKHDLARFIGLLKLDPIILDEQPEIGISILDKFRKHSDVAFAIVIFSNDDIGYSKSDGPDKAKARPRQNAVFELGFFLGMSENNNAVVLTEDRSELEMLSDYSGVITLDYDSGGAWKMKLASDLKQRGFNIDMNNLIK